MFVPLFNLFFSLRLNDKSSGDSSESKDLLPIPPGRTRRRLILSKKQIGAQVLAVALTLMFSVVCIRVFGVRYRRMLGFSGLDILTSTSFKSGCEGKTLTVQPVWYWSTFRRKIKVFNDLSFGFGNTNNISETKWIISL